MLTLFLCRKTKQLFFLLLRRFAWGLGGLFRFWGFALEHRQTILAFRDFIALRNCIQSALFFLRGKEINRLLGPILQCSIPRMQNIAAALGIAVLVRHTTSPLFQQRNQTQLHIHRRLFRVDTGEARYSHSCTPLDVGVILHQA